MKHLPNENAFRTWFITEYLGIDGKYPSIFSPEEIEMAVPDKMPQGFPCVVILIPDGGVYRYGQEEIRYLYRQDIIKFGHYFGLEFK
ncbi:UNVERIFIED_ORG: hypothetical protein M2355_002151 [Lelliottia amnigena]|nr:hypothetical protein [Lelliottia amnigena]